MTNLQHTGGATIQALAAKLKALGGPPFKSDLGAAMGIVALRELYKGFRQSVDPYGKAWKPVDRTSGRGKRQKPGRPLIRTGHLRASATMEVNDLGFRIALAAEYARYHQYGTRGRRGVLRRVLRARGRGGIERRQMVPMRSTGGLGNWGPPLARAARGVINQWRHL